jgi:hypothetical protein
MASIRPLPSTQTTQKPTFSIAVTHTLQKQPHQRGRRGDRHTYRKTNSGALQSLIRRFDLTIQLWGSEQYSSSYGPRELGCSSYIYSIKMRDRQLFCR